ncbi:hypothetical protein B0H13DRAFT_2329539 [Mycena leptocephala]|nr:hypothetical protein B0H13DRAFT_2329539 [Mycena leptocephala]
MLTPAQESGALLQDVPVRGKNRPPTILSLATELTAEIFVHCLPELTSAPQTDTAPLLLGRICSTWRDIALATPELWSRLNITGSGAYAAHWLARAGDWPLTLVVEYPEDELIAVLKEHAPRWRDVFLRLSFAQFQSFGSDLHLPLLQRLNISLDSTYAPENHDPIGAFRNAPALRQLVTEFYLPPADIVLPWAQLTSINAYRMEFHECLDVLQFASNLVECRFSFEPLYSGDLLNVSPLPPLLFLKSLWIFSRRDGSDMLDYISAPALEKLEFAFSVGHVLYLQSIQNLISRSGCQLRELIIPIEDENVDYTPAGELEQLLYDLPALERLELRDGPAKSLIAVSHQLSRDLSFLPRLSRFRATTHFHRLIDAMIGIPGGGNGLDQRIGDAFSGLLEVIVDGLSKRWVAPEGSCSRILECIITYGRHDYEPSYVGDPLLLRMNQTLAAFQPRLDELGAQGINVYVGAPKS